MNRCNTVTQILSVKRKLCSINPGYYSKCARSQFLRMIGTTRKIGLHDYQSNLKPSHLMACKYTFHLNSQRLFSRLVSWSTVEFLYASVCVWDTHMYMYITWKPETETDRYITVLTVYCNAILYNCTELRITLCNTINSCENEKVRAHQYVGVK